MNLTLKFNGDNSFLKLYRNYIKAYINLTFGLYNINRTNRDGDFNEIISFDMWTVIIYYQFDVTSFSPWNCESLITGSLDFDIINLLMQKYFLKFPIILWFVESTETNVFFLIFSKISYPPPPPLPVSLIIIFSSNS